VAVGDITGRVGRGHRISGVGRAMFGEEVEGVNTLSAVPGGLADGDSTL